MTAETVAALPVSSRAYAKRCPVYPPTILDELYGWPEGTTHLIRHTHMTDEELGQSAEPQRVNP